jgi:hypothetical protein
MKRTLLLSLAALGVAFFASNTARAAAAWDVALYTDPSHQAYEGASQDYYTGNAILTHYSTWTDSMDSQRETIPRPSGATWLTDAAAGLDGNRWLLWQGNNNDGHAYITKINSWGTTYSSYMITKPAGWVATRITGCSDRPCVLWKDGQGHVQVWKAPPDPQAIVQGPVYGPYAGWDAVDLTGNNLPDNLGATIALLWRSSAGSSETIWVLNPQAALASNMNFTAPSGMIAARFEQNDDGGEYAVLWTKPDGKTCRSGNVTPPPADSFSGTPATISRLSAELTLSNSFTYGALDISYPSNTSRRRILWTTPYGMGYYATQSLSYYGVAEPAIFRVH